MTALAKIPSAITATLDYQVFKKAIANACKVVDKRNTIPALSTVLIKGNRRGVQVIGTDLDLYTTTSVPGSATADFVALIDAHKLKATMDKVKDAADILFELDGDTLTAVIGKLRLNLKQDMPIADFPDEQAFRTKLKQSNYSFVLPSTKLAEILTKTEFAMSTEETRYYLRGIFMHSSERAGRLNFVATDGHRLARFAADLPAGAGGIPPVIIPQKTVAEVLRLVKRKGCPADTLITVTESGVSFLIGDDELIESKTIDGTFPDYERVIPANVESKATAFTGPLIEAIKTVSAISSERGRSVKFRFQPGKLVLTCTDPDFGTASTELKIDNEREIEIGFNAGYLLETIPLIEGAAEFRLNGAGDPAIIADTAKAEVTFVQMPMRV